MLTLRLCVSSILAGKKPDLPMPGVPGKKVVSRLPPPPDKEEELPSPRAGVVWSRGYWAFQGGWFVWRGGHWELSRPGHAYVAPHWMPTGSGWQFHAASWLPQSDPTAAPSQDDRTETAYDPLAAFR